MRHWYLFLICFMLCASPSGAAADGLVTIADGKGNLLRGDMVYGLKEGVSVLPGDILESADVSFFQIEFADGTGLGLAPQTALLLGAAPNGADRAGDVYLLSGSVKVSGGARAGLLRTTSALLSASTKDATYVLRRLGNSADVFVESGKLSLGAPGISVGATLKSGDYVERKAAGSLSTATHPPAAYVSALPRTFLDTLPLRWAIVSNRKAEATLLRGASFEEADRWMKGYASERKTFLKRFAGLLKDKVFRAEVEARIAQFPEWDRRLHPEKYTPKVPPLRPSSKAAP